MRTLILLMALVIAGCGEVIVDPGCPEPAPSPALVAWCQLEAAPRLPRVIVEDRDQVLDLSLGDRFILPVNPSDDMREISLPLPVPSGETPWPAVIELNVPTLLRGKHPGARYRIVREGGVAGHAIAFFMPAEEGTPCVAAYFHSAGGETWTLGMTSPNVVPGMDAGQWQ